MAVPSDKSNPHRHSSSIVFFMSVSSFRAWPRDVLSLLWSLAVNITIFPENARKSGHGPPAGTKAMSDASPTSQFFQFSQCSQFRNPLVQNPSGASYSSSSSSPNSPGSPAASGSPISRFPRLSKFSRLSRLSRRTDLAGRAARHAIECILRDKDVPSPLSCIRRAKNVPPSTPRRRSDVLTQTGPFDARPLRGAAVCRNLGSDGRPRPGYRPPAPRPDPAPTPASRPG